MEAVVELPFSSDALSHFARMQLAGQAELCEMCLVAPVHGAQSRAMIEAPEILISMKAHGMQLQLLPLQTANISFAEALLAAIEEEARRPVSVSSESAAASDCSE